MFRKLLRYLFYVVSLPAFGHQAPVATMLDETGNYFKLSDRVYVLEDPHRTIDFRKILSDSIDKKFVINEAPVPNLGFTNSSYWFKFIVRNNIHRKKVLLEIAYPFLNKMDMYIPDLMGDYKKKSVGDHYVFSKREIKNKNFLFEVEFYPFEEKVFYAHIDCDGEATSFPISIWKELAHGQKDYEQQIALGLYYGIMLFALFLSLFLGFTLFERTYAFYFFYIIGFGLFQFSLEGLAFEYFWPNNTWLANHIIPLAGSFAIFCLIRFSQSLLITKQNTPTIHKILYFVAIVDLAMLTASLFGNPFYSVSLKSLNFIAIASNLLIFSAAIVSYRKGYRPARYFLAAFSLLIIGVLMAMFKNFGFIPRIFITEYGIQIGSAIEIILLSFALSERLKILKGEKEKAQALLVEQLREKNELQEKINIQLEKMVVERTHEINLQKKIIEERNKDITDSISYAKSIQDATLPVVAEIQAELKELFILFLPKDIVSGDFYWFAKKGDIVLIAAADCTGHGVPGALMSMLGNSLLNEIVNDNNLVQPAEILDKLREMVIKTLKQKKDNWDTQDGMDIAVCSFDFKNNRLQYAGAFNSLYMIREQRFTEIAADRFTIGINKGKSDKQFTLHEFDLLPNDQFYLFTDGFANQFGGKDTKKMTHKQFRELLLRHQHLPMEEQKTALETALITWMGDHRQMDDILVMGIRI